MKYKQEQMWVDLGDEGEPGTYRAEIQTSSGNRTDRMYRTDRHVSDNTISMGLKPLQPCCTSQHRGLTWTVQNISVL